MRREERIEVFVRKVWAWYGQNKRELPWRELHSFSEDERAYRVFISEVMLQQTQVQRVIVIFQRFLEHFPTLSDLAHASNAEVVIAWRGMGYNSRALRLRDSARIIIGRYSGVFPKGMEDLRSLPGIGRYTAAAIRNFAFDLPTPCIETNIRRALHTEFVGPQNADGTWRRGDGYLLKLAGEALEVALRRGEGRGAADWHHALMDYGALVKGKNAKKAKSTKSTRREPGRYVGSTYVPNRIFRGRIVETLRDEARGLPFSEIGKRVCIDWEPAEHRKWLEGVLRNLEKDVLIERRRQRYVLGS